MIGCFPFPATSRWDGYTAFIASGTTRISLDPEERTGLSEAIPQESAMEDGKLIHQQYVFPDGTRVRVLQFKGAGRDGGDIYRLVVHKPRQTRAEVLVENSVGQFVMVPAPNRKLLAIRCSLDSEGKQTKILVVGRGGGGVMPKSPVSRK